MIKYETKKVIDVYDWDALAEETYGRPYNLQQQNGCQEKGFIRLNVKEDFSPEWHDFGKDEIPFKINGNEMGVSFKAWSEANVDEINSHFETNSDLFWYRNFYPDLTTLANDLYKKGLIELGEYLIEIDW